MRRRVRCVACRVERVEPVAPGARCACGGALVLVPSIVEAVAERGPELGWPPEYVDAARRALAAQAKDALAAHDAPADVIDVAVAGLSPDLECE